MMQRYMRVDLFTFSTFFGLSVDKNYRSHSIPSPVLSKALKKASIHFMAYCVQNS